MSEGRQLVFANMLFNLGLARFKGFKGMLARAKEGRYSEAADEMVDSKWAQRRLDHLDPGHQEQPGMD